jgi:tetratricopeptide (TPR) repeat protein
MQRIAFSLLTSCCALVSIVTAQNDAATWPSARAAHVMVYHARLRSVLMMGGADSANDALFSWNGREWKRLSTSGPIGRGHFGFAYDPARDRLVLQGGSLWVPGGQPPRFGDTWEWDGRQWRLMPTTDGPGLRDHHAMVYDPNSRQIILFGGADPTARMLSDTWAWDGRAWRKIAVDGPPGRTTHRLTYDPVRRVVVLFGGWGDGGRLLNDTWEWNGQQWTQKSAEGPTPRFAARTAFDGVRNRVLLYGGRSSTGDLSDTWEWDGTRWTKIDVAAPPLRNVHELMYDASRRRVVLFGGFHAPRNLNDLWEWDGNAWAPVARFQVTPPAGGFLQPGPHVVGYRLVNRYDHTRAYTPRRDYQGRPATGETATPFQVSVWYPARSAGNRMRVGDYAAIDPTRETLAEVTATQREVARGNFIGSASFTIGSELPVAEADRILDQNVNATRDAEPAQGSFPLVLFGAESGPSGAYGLAEYLASHGYIVVAAGSLLKTATLQATNAAAALDAQTHQLGLLYDFGRTIPSADPQRLGVIGKNFDGLAALNYQMRNLAANAVVTLDGWEAKPVSTTILRGSAFFDPVKLRVPYLTFQQDNPPTPQLRANRDLFDQLKYSERQMYVLHNMDHFRLLQHTLVYPHVTDEQRLAYDFYYRTIRDFLDAHVNADSAALRALRSSTAQRGYPAWLFKEQFAAPALAAVPTAEELESLVMSGDIARVVDVLRAARRENPDGRLFTRETMNLYAFRYWQRNERDKAIQLRQLNAEAYPNSVHAHNDLGNAYRDSGQPQLALGSFERALALVDSDSEIAANEKEASREVIRRKIEALRPR